MSLTDEKIDKVIDQLSARDNVFFLPLFHNNKEAAELLYNVSLGRDDIVLKGNPVTDYYLKNLFGDSVRFDLHGEHAELNEQYDAEMENDERGVNPKRTRMYSSMLDSNTRTIRKDYKDLPDHYVIFFPDVDYYGKGKPRYAAERMVDGDPYEDGSHIVIINGARDSDEDDLSRLVHDLKCAVPEEMYYEPIRKRAIYLKRTKKGRAEMTETLRSFLESETEEVRMEAEARGRAIGNAEGEKRGKISSARNMLTMGLSIDQIRQATGLSAEEIARLRN